MKTRNLEDRLSVRELIARTFWWRRRPNIRPCGKVQIIWGQPPEGVDGDEDVT